MSRGDCDAAECTGNIGDDEYINSQNIRSFEGCTVIKGAIKIYQTALTGYVALRRVVSSGCNFVGVLALLGS